MVSGSEKTGWGASFCVKRKGHARCALGSFGRRVANMRRMDSVCLMRAAAAWALLASVYSSPFLVHICGGSGWDCAVGSSGVYSGLYS